MEWITHLVSNDTLFIVNALLAAVSSLMFLALYMTGRKVQRVRGLLILSVSYAAYAAGFGVIMLPAFGIDFPHVNIMGNLTLDMATILVLFAVSAYLRRPLLQWWVLLPVAAIGVAEVYLLQKSDKDYFIMVIFGCSLRGLLTIATGIMLWHHGRKISCMAARFTAIFHFLWALMLLSRIGWWSTHPNVDIDYDPTSTFGLLSRMVLTSIITPGFLWMLTHKMNDELIRHASQDALTGVANRRVMWQHGESSAQEARRKSEPVAVLMVDIDNFKAINDRHGHAVGDIALVTIANLMSQQIHRPDLLARVGGEEFMILVPHGDEAAVHALAERLRRTIESQPVPEPSGDTLTCTVSIGYCISIQAQAEWQTLVVAADQALYTSKRNGRNRVTGTVLS
ncbi:GGDEF domain-containing protein [Xanthomonas albilineans]|nr:GGDEF domain-containing protein [Xanthomonas albilineans]